MTMVEPYGYVIEFKDIKHKNQQWENHWNHKIYTTDIAAMEAIVQMKSAYSFYRDNYEWRLIALFQLNHIPI